MPAVYFAGALGLVMASFHPVFVCLALIFGLAYGIYLKGWPAVAKSLGWQVPLVVVVALINPLVGAQGSTVLFTLFGRAIKLEKIFYGICMGELLLATIAWFSCATQVMTAEKVTLLTGRVAPVVGTTITMATKLVPVYARRAVAVDEAMRANTAARAAHASETQDGRFARMKASVAEVSRRISVLMGWGMEDSLETADSMLARGWGSEAKHTSYRRYRFTVVDGAALAAVCGLFALACVGSIRLSGPFGFYPELGPWAGGAWWGYAAFAVYLGLPLAFEGGAKLLWKN